MRLVKKGPVSQLKETTAKLDLEAKALRDKYLRALADFENYRKRTQRELERFQQNANEFLLTSLIPVLENLDRALASAEQDKCFDGLYKGMEIVSRQLKETLAKHGMIEYSALGEAFDPQRHEAVGSIETGEHPSDTIVAEQAKGYLYNSRVLRPARVLVAKPKPDENEQKANNEGGSNG